MSYHVELGWKIFSSLSPQGDEKTKLSSPLFNIKGANSFLRTLGGNPRVPYAPITVEPTKNFHHALRSSKSELGVEGKQLSFTIFFDQIQQRLQVTVGLRRYLSCICASVRVQTFSVDRLAAIVDLQDLKSHKVLFRFVCEILAITTSGTISIKKLSELPKIFPVIQIMNLGTQTEDTSHRLVEILTRHTIEERDIVDSVIQKNKTHQIDKTLVLIDRQGILSYLPPNCSTNQVEGNLQRFKNASSLMEFANAIKRDVKSGFISSDHISRIINDAKYFLPDSISAQRMWGLLMSEFSMQYELEQRSELSMISTTRNILVVTVTDIETTAILNAFNEKTGHSATIHPVDGHPYHCLGKVGGFNIFLSRSEMGASGMGGSQATVSRSIKALSPEFVIMVGIAFGIDKEKQAIGQILVSKQLYLYELQRISKDNSIALRGDKPSSSTKLLSWVNAAKESWGGAKVEPGLILSGEKLIDNTDYRNQLQSLVPEAIGGEMEGTGLYVACQSEKVDWILIKAVCDWADGNKGRNKRAKQEEAAKSASAFTAHLISVMKP